MVRHRSKKKALASRAGSDSQLSFAFHDCCAIVLPATYVNDFKPRPDSPAPAVGPEIKRDCSI
jgi:hypothetical protein